MVAITHVAYFMAVSSNLWIGYRAWKRAYGRKIAMWHFFIAFFMLCIWIYIAAHI